MKKEKEETKITPYTRVPIQQHYHSLCPTAIQQLAEIHLEGDTRYGLHNWTEGEKANIKNDAVNHMLAHLMKYMQGDRSEKHMAKIMWGCAAIIHHDSGCEHQFGVNLKERK